MIFQVFYVFLKKVALAYEIYAYGIPNVILIEILSGHCFTLY